jgi:hypothetical protein
LKHFELNNLLCEALIALEAGETARAHPRGGRGHRVGGDGLAGESERRADGGDD